jgi:hypothetical protein
MMMAMGMTIGLVLINILCLVFFIIVLVKLFKNEGALKGILGLFCSIYTFIWGWMKHKQLGMTKIMATWSILTVLGIVMVPVMGVSSAIMLPQYMQQMAGGEEIKFSKVAQPAQKKKFNIPRKNKKTNAKAGPQKSSQPSMNHPKDWSQRALALWQGSQYEDPNKAINYWNHAISSEKNKAAAYSNRGLAYHELKQYQMAIKDFSRAIKLDPEYATAYNNRGNSYYELNEYRQALNDYSQSLKIEPKYAKAHLNRGLAYYQMNQTRKACKDFQQSCDQGDCDGLKWSMKNGICN